MKLKTKEQENRVRIVISDPVSKKALGITVLDTTIEEMKEHIINSIKDGE